MKLKPRNGSWILVLLFLIAWISPITARATSSSISIPNAGFEDGTLTGWSRGSQTGTLGTSINGSGTGVTVFNGSRTFTHGANGAMGSPTITKAIPNTSPQQYEIVDNPYYAPAVVAGSWTFSPKGGTYAVALQPKGEQTFTQATAALGLSETQTSQIATMLSSQAQASGFGSGNPTDAAWITREVQLTAGITYTMSWNYMATDYVPFNDGSITSLVPVTVASTPAITVNNFNQSYALLGFSNPGTGDYSTNSYGATGWQVSTYKVSVTGTYKLGFTSFNLDDQGLPPVLMVDDQIGTTLSCNQSGGSCAVFGGVEPNNETAPTLPPTTTTTSTSTTTTTVAPYLNSVTDLTATSNADGSVDLDWDAPASSNVDIYGYAVTFYDLDEIGGTQSGGWGVSTNQGTNYSLSKEMFSGSNPVTTGYGPVRFGIKAGNQSCFSSEGVGPCVYGPEITVDATVFDPTPSTTTTTTTTTTTEVPVTTTTQAPVFTLPPFLSTTSSTTTTVVPMPAKTTTTTTTPAPTTTTTTVAPTNTTIVSSTTTTTTTAPIVTTTTIPQAPIVQEVFEILNTNQQLNNEEFTKVIEVLQSDNLTSDQVATVIDQILKNQITADQATELATSEKVLESIDGDQASEIFAEIPVGELSTEEEAALVEAVTNAPDEIKDAFEETIDVYGEGLDDYVPVGSNVDVQSRRTLLAATAVLTAATAGAVGSTGGSGGSGGSSGGSGGSSRGSGGGSGGSGGGPGDGGNGNGRKENENPDGEEEDSEIEGPEDQEDNNFTRNSIFKYEEETMKRRFSPWGFIKKLGRETSALAFTISSSVVVFATLSGETRKITIIATSCAFAVHYIYAMIKNDED
jgi:uncharacterized membrane protein YgcG